MKKKIAVIFAHPDDESVTCGGTLFQVSRLGHDVVMVCATNGQASEVFNESCATKDKLGEVRKKELQKAANILGVNKVHFLDYMDGQLSNQDISKSVSVLKNILDQEGPDIIIFFEPKGVVCHPDHIATSQWCQVLLEEELLAKKPEKIYQMTTAKKHGWSAKRAKGLIGHDDKDITTVVDIREVHDLKKEAILCHQSQMPTFVREEIIKEGKLNKYFPYEYFIRVDSKGNKLDIKESFIV